MEFITVTRFGDDPRYYLMPSAMHLDGFLAGLTGSLAHLVTCSGCEQKAASSRGGTALNSALGDRPPVHCINADIRAAGLKLPSFARTARGL